MNQYPEYHWTEEGKAYCIIKYKNMSFTGEAQCHPDDMDVMSKLTGYNIAELRALIQFLRFIRDYEMRPQIKALYQLYYSMKHSKHYNRKSYEAKMLYKQIHHLEKNMEDVKGLIQHTKNELKKYIGQKEADHTKIREIIAKRNLVDNNQNTCD